MKRLILILAVVAMLLPSCKKINEAIDGLDNRLDKLEQETIPSIDEQISAINTTLENLDSMDKELKGYIDNLTTTASSLQEQINATNIKIDEVKAELKNDITSTEDELKEEIETAKANVIAQLEAAKEAMENELATINATIATLQAKDAELDNKIAELRSYVDTELGDTTDWVNATFATLEQYNALVSEVATIKEQIKAINQSITNLETRLTTKINEDIANAVSTLNADIQQKVSEITSAYTNAVKTAKEEITTAYTTAIQNAINALDVSLKAWVGEQLANYYTIAQIDAMLAAMEQDMNGKLEAQKAYLEGLINEISISLTKSIADNKVLIEGLQKDITTVQGTVAEQASKIAQNASTIAANTQNIIDLSKAIYTNKDNISANEKAIASNKALIEANAKLIAENKSAIEALKNSTSTSITANATAIAKNAEDIAQNAALISANAIAINNNAAAIADNAADILQLQQSLAATKIEITEAYQKAINDAITTNNGVIDTKIAAQVQTINSRIDNEVATINSTIATLTSRIAAVENEIATIQQQIAAILEDIEDIKDDIAKLLARIQSVSYIPTYSDGKATVKYNGDVSCVTFDFEVSPKDAVAELGKVWRNAVSIKAVYTQTRAVEFIDMPIVNCDSDITNGVISVVVSGENLSADFFAGTQTASARLSISDGNNTLTSEYIPMVAKEVPREDVGIIPNNEIWYTSSDGNIVTPTYLEGISIIANTYENGCGTIKCNQEITSLMSPEFSFSGCTTLTSIILPHSVIDIGAGAFSGCSALISITLSDNLKYFDAMATFGGCSSLTAFYGKHSSKDNRCVVIDGKLQYVTTVGISEYTIPDDINTIGFYAFAYSGHLKSIIIPSSVTIIEDYVFVDCSSLTNLTISEGVTQIGSYAFCGCKNLTSVTIPNSVTSIGDNAFGGCKKLTSLYGRYASGDNRCIIIDGALKAFAPSGISEYTIPSEALTIAANVFEGTSLTSLTIPNTVTAIGYGAFGECHSLRNVTIGNGLETIGSWAFYNCNNLEYINIPNCVTSIGEHAFDDCDSLTSVTIPDSVTSIGKYAFYGCQNLSMIDVANLSAWCEIDFANESSNPVYYTKELYLNGELVSELVVPSDVTEIKPFVFYNCVGLTSISIPNNVSSIGNKALYGCKNLTSITIPDNVTSIGSNAFGGCSGELILNCSCLGLYGGQFTKVTIGNSVTSIRYDAFKYCTSLTSVTIPDSVTSIGSYAFSDCTSLKEVYCKPTTPPTGGSSMFNKNTSGRKIYVPSNSVSAYKSASGWSNYASAIVGYDFENGVVAE